MSSVAASPYRVVQWATGNIGSRSLRAVIEHPSLELVGLFVYAPEKAGHDAGDLAGLASTGVTATTSIADIVSLNADCVLYMARDCKVDELCALLESGANVVTTRGEFHNPDAMDATLRQRIEDACARGGTTIHSTGSSPGFISEAMPFVLSSIQRRLDSLLIEEFADLSKRNSPELLFDLMGFGNAPDSFDQTRWSFGAQSFGPSLRLVAASIGLPLDDVVGSGAVAVATADVEIAAGTITGGTVAAQRVRVDGLRGGEPFISFSASWYCTDQLDPAWDLRPTGWRLTVRGDAPLDVEVRFAVPLEEMAERSPGYTANRAVNAVSVVCASAPGIRTSVDLPQIVGSQLAGPPSSAPSSPR